MICSASQSTFLGIEVSEHVQYEVAGYCIPAEEVSLAILAPVPESQYHMLQPSQLSESTSQYFHSLPNLPRANLIKELRLINRLTSQTMSQPVSFGAIDKAMRRSFFIAVDPVVVYVVAHVSDEQLKQNHVVFDHVVCWWLRDTSVGGGFPDELPYVEFELFMV